MTEMIFLTKDEMISSIENSVAKAFDEAEKKRKMLEKPKLFTKNKIAKITGLSHPTISKLCANGVIKTTLSGLIEESEIERYLASR